MGSPCSSSYSPLTNTRLSNSGAQNQTKQSVYILEKLRRKLNSRKQSENNYPLSNNIFFLNPVKLNPLFTKLLEDIIGKNFAAVNRVIGYWV